MESISLSSPAEAERISLGEEVTNRFIKNTLAIGIDQWNHAVSMVHEKDPKELLALLESATDEKELEDQVESLQRKLNVQLPRISLKQTEGGFQTLALKALVGAGLHFRCIYIYIYIY